MLIWLAAALLCCLALALLLVLYELLTFTPLPFTSRPSRGLGHTKYSADKVPDKVDTANLNKPICEVFDASAVGAMDLKLWRLMRPLAHWDGVRSAERHVPSEQFQLLRQDVSGSDTWS